MNDFHPCAKCAISLVATDGRLCEHCAARRIDDLCAHAVTLFAGQRDAEARLAAALAIVEPLEVLAKKATQGVWAEDFIRFVLIQAHKAELPWAFTQDDASTFRPNASDAAHIAANSPATILRLARALRGETE